MKRLGIGVIAAAVALVGSALVYGQEADSPALIGTVWQWQETLMNDGTRFAPEDPANYTVEFLADGSLSIQADCNRATGAYTLDGSSISVVGGATTLMACPDDSLGSEFLAQLGSAAIFFFQDGELYLDLKFDSGTMRFMPQPPSLTGTVWLWQETLMNDGAVIAPDNPANYNILLDDEGRFTFQADCNRGSGGYTVEADGQISLMPGPMTLMACPEGSLGDVFVQQLSDAAIYFFQNGDLFMDIKFDSGTMRFAAQPSALAGTSWVVTVYNNGREAAVGPLPETELTAAFDAEGRVSGSAGCNSYTASFTTTPDGGISIGPAASTRKFCSAPEGIMDQETAFLAALASAATYQVRGDMLEMRTADDAIAVMFVKAE